MTFTTTNGAVTGFDFNLSTPPSPYRHLQCLGQLNSTDTKIESRRRRLRGLRCNGELALSAHSFACLEDSCIHATDTACEAIGDSAPTNPSFTYQFYQPPASTAVPEIGSAGAGAGLTLLMGALAVVRGRKLLG